MPLSPPKCYTVPQLLELLQLARSTFFMLKATGQLPFLEELRPRAGRKLRFRADLVDRYLAGEGLALLRRARRPRTTSQSSQKARRAGRRTAEGGKTRAEARRG